MNSNKPCILKTKNILYALALQNFKRNWFVLALADQNKGFTELLYLTVL